MKSCNVIVKKYGGTSVGTIERVQEVAKQIKDSLSIHTKKQAVVVSAMSGETNRLLAMSKNLDENAPDEYKDFVVASGEQISCGLLAIALNRIGVRAQPFTALQLGIFTDSTHAEARIDRIDTKQIEHCWLNGITPIVAGFQGVSPEKKITTLGRGGSDTTAVALAAALKADLCEIYTDVDGVYSADPRVVSQAKLLKKVDYDSCLELAALGGKVLHHRCVEIAAKYSLPLVVKNSFNPGHVRDLEGGTMIVGFSHQEAIEAPVVTAVTVVKDVAKVTINDIPNMAIAISELFEFIASEHINVDIIVQNVAHNKQAWVGFSINKTDIEKCKHVVDAFCKKHAIVQPPIFEAGFSKVSVVGLGMRSRYGVASKMFQCLENQNIKIHMISTSEIKISCLVEEAYCDKAVQTVHESYFGK